MQTLKEARQHRGMSLADVAQRLGVTRATVQGYERSDARGTIRSDTRQRVLAAMDITPQQPTRDQTRSLLLHFEVAAHLISDPERTIEIARRNMRSWGERDRRDRYWLQRWERVLGEPPARIAMLLTEQSQDAADLRQGTPFAGVLSVEERRAAIERARELDMTVGA